MITGATRVARHHPATTLAPGSRPSSVACPYSTAAQNCSSSCWSRWPLRSRYPDRRRTPADSSHRARPSLRCTDRADTIVYVRAGKREHIYDRLRTKSKTAPASTPTGRASAKASAIAISTVVPHCGQTGAAAAMVKGRSASCLATDQTSHVARSRRIIQVRSVQNGSGQSHCSQFILFSSSNYFLR
jgi:hypothetical protein